MIWPLGGKPHQTVWTNFPVSDGAFSVAGCSFGRNHQPTERLGVGVVGLLHFGGIVQAQYGKT